MRFPPRPQHLVDVVGHRLICQWHGVGIIPQGRRGVAMAESILRLEEVSSTNEIGGHGVAKSVEARSLQAGLVSKFGEPMTQPSGGQTPAMVQVPGEEPLSEFGRARALAPGHFTGPPEFDRRPPQREPAYLSGLGRSDLFRRCRPFDREHPAVKVPEAQGHQLPPSRTRIRGQADQESHLLRFVQCAQRTCRPVERAVSPRVVGFEVSPRVHP